LAKKRAKRATIIDLEKRKQEVQAAIDEGCSYGEVTVMLQEKYGLSFRAAQYNLSKAYLQWYKDNLPNLKDSRAEQIARIKKLFSEAKTVDEHCKIETIFGKIMGTFNHPQQVEAKVDQVIHCEVVDYTSDPEDTPEDSDEAY